MRRRKVNEDRRRRRRRERDDDDDDEHREEEKGGMEFANLSRAASRKGSVISELHDGVNPPPAPFPRGGSQSHGDGAQKKVVFRPPSPCDAAAAAATSTTAAAMAENGSVSSLSFARKRATYLFECLWLPPSPSPLLLFASSKPTLFLS